MLRPLPSDITVETGKDSAFRQESHELKKTGSRAGEGIGEAAYFCIPQSLVFYHPPQARMRAQAAMSLRMLTARELGAASYAFYAARCQPVAFPV